MHDWRHKLQHFYKSRSGTGVILEVTPESAGWKYLGFRVIALRAGETYREQTEGTEVALVPLKGNGVVEVSHHGRTEPRKRVPGPKAGPGAGWGPDARFELSRENVFAGASNVLYVPPRQGLTVTAASDFMFTTGRAPAEGKYPTRLFTPGEMRQEVRGGGAATRQVNHVLAHPLPAERLILFEVYVPGGMWSGWPPHRHDGNGAPYLEETYYYLFEPDNGFGIQRNYRDETGFDELFTVKNGDVAVVAEGYHPVACAPGANMYFLNYQAGDLLDGGRGTPPYEDPTRVWIKDNWDRNLLRLPVGEKQG